MLAKIYSAAVQGVDAVSVEIEVNAGRGETMKIVIVGLPDTAVRESGDRVFTACINSGFATPFGRTTINLAPADLRKEGPSFDLPIALGLIAAMDGLPGADLSSVMMVGELALSGEVRKVRGVLPIALCARSMGCRRILVPSGNAEEAAVVRGLDVIPVQTLREAADFLGGDKVIPPAKVNVTQRFQAAASYEVDYQEVKGQESTRRAVEVAIAGGHNILLIGSPVIQ